MEIYKSIVKEANIAQTYKAHSYTETTNINVNIKSLFPRRDYIRR